jgi:hypothetical protein
MGMLTSARFSDKSMSSERPSPSEPDNYPTAGSDTTFGGPAQTRQIRHALGADFKPNDYTVLCGRGSLYSEASGNKYLKHLVQQAVPAYADTPSRTGKSGIVTTILHTIRQASPKAAFVKFEDGEWREVDDSVAREKIGTVFRDILHDRYKSSNKAKVARRSMRRSLALQKDENEFGHVISRNMSVGSLEASLPRHDGPASPPDESSSYEEPVFLQAAGIVPQSFPSAALPPLHQDLNIGPHEHEVSSSSKSSFPFFQSPDGASLPTASMLVDSDLFDEDTAADIAQSAFV